LGLLTCKNRLPYNLYCVGGDVKHCTIQSSDVDDHLLISLVVTYTLQGRRTCDSVNGQPYPSVLHGIRNQIFPSAFSALFCYSGWSQIVRVI